MRTKLLLLTISFCHIICISAWAQNNQYDKTRLALESISLDVPQLDKKVSFSISNIELYEFLRALGNNNKLNLNVDPSLKNIISINFVDVTIKDLLKYLGEQYNLQIESTGNIISIKKQPPTPAPDPVIISKIAKVFFDSTNKLITLDLESDTLKNVLRQITDYTGYNFFAEKLIENKIISSYIKDMPVLKAVDELANINKLEFIKRDSTTFYINTYESDEKSLSSKRQTISNNTHIITNKLDSIISIEYERAKIKDILSAVAQELQINYFLLTDIKGETNIKLENIEFEKFLKHLFNATEYSYTKSGSVYIIGDKKSDHTQAAKVYQMKHRTLDKLTELIPAIHKKNVEIIPIEDLNSLVITGSDPDVNDMLLFLNQIDKVVPVINIELIILDIRNSHTVSTGIIAGVDKSQSKSTYPSVFPSIDMTLSSNTINNIIEGINGTGLVNLGSVTPDFYVGLKASEDNGSLKIRSTPRLATLNGKEANMIIGETRYYIEQTTNVITTQSTTTVTGINYKELQANFGIKIKPIVSGDEQITLDISVEQSTFTEQATKNGPYGRLTRSFQSSVRVKNNEMILLGGLQEKNSSNAGNGFPVLSRIPVIKWLFSSRSKSSKKSKLVILIHPTVFY